MGPSDVPARQKIYTDMMPQPRTFRRRAGIPAVAATPLQKFFVEALIVTLDAVAHPDPDYQNGVMGANLDDSHRDQPTRRRPSQSNARR
jgi:hypothetical protein